jgi:hypothetical protein
MGIEDELRRIQREEAERQRLEAAWDASIIKDYHPRVVQPPPHLKPVLDEARALLPFKESPKGVSPLGSAVIGTGPDGVTRVNLHVTRKTLLGNYKKVGNTLYAAISVGMGGRDSPDPTIIIFKERVEVSYRHCKLKHIENLSAEALSTFIANFISRARQW